MQSNSYSTLEARSPRVENGMPYNSFTITGGIHNYQAAELGQNLAVPGHDSTTNVASPFGPPVTELCNPFYSPNHDALLVERQPDYSANSYSGIGSHFPLDKTPVFEGNPFMDPVFSQDLSTAVYLNPDSIAAGQPSSEYDLEDFNLNLSTDLPVPPTVLTARAHLNSPCCEVSIPITHTDRAVMPTKATTWTASAMDYLWTGSPTPSSISPSVAPVETAHLNRPSRVSHPYHNALSRATSTPIAPRNPPASLSFPGSGMDSTFTASTEESSYPNLAFDRLHQKTSPSRGALKPIQPKAIDYCEYDESLGAIPFRNPSSSARVSVTGPKVRYGISRCPWKGCFTITTRKSHKSNMRNHVRMTHEQPAPPICEVCGRHYKKNDSLKNHLNLKHEFKIPTRVWAVKKKKADGTLFFTYQQVYDYVNKRKMKKLWNLFQRRQGHGYEQLSRTTICSLTIARTWWQVAHTNNTPLHRSRRRIPLDSKKHPPSFSRPICHHPTQ